MIKWKDISTAPEDCEILVAGGVFRLYGYDKEGNIQDISEQSRVLSVWNGYDEDSGVQYHFIGGEFVEPPTHWAEMPPLPKVGE